MRLTRRNLLAASALVATGCRHQTPRRSLDPDAVALTAARDGERRLIAAYDAAIAARPATATTLSAVRAQHLTHLTALGGVLPSEPPQQSSQVGAAGLAAAEDASLGPLQAAAIGARSGATAALLASVAASHAVLGGIVKGLS